MESRSSENEMPSRSLFWYAGWTPGTLVLLFGPILGQKGAMPGPDREFRHPIGLTPISSSRLLWEFITMRRSDHPFKDTFMDLPVFERVWSFPKPPAVSTLDLAHISLLSPSIDTILTFFLRLVSYTMFFYRIHRIPIHCWRTRERWRFRPQRLHSSWHRRDDLETKQKQVESFWEDQGYFQLRSCSWVQNYLGSSS